MRRYQSYALWAFVAALGGVAGLVGLYSAVANRAESNTPADGPAFFIATAPDATGVYSQGELAVGTPAPDFTLPAVDGSPPVHLADRLGRRPVVLALGNFGCTYFCNRLDEVRRLHERFGDRADFLLVYVDNRHDEPDALRAVVADPSAPADAAVNRRARIRAGLRQYDLPLACVDDWEEKQVTQAYRAFPAKLVIIDTSGRVAFDSGSVLRSGLNIPAAETWLETHTAAE